MLRLALLFFLSRLHPSATDSEFQLVYGNALAQKLSDTADDAETAVQIGKKALQTHTNRATLTLDSFAKSRLYYTSDGATPYIFEQEYIISNQHFLQRMHISIGYLYTMTLTSREGVCHNVTLTRHLSNDYYFYRHTFTARQQLSKSFVNCTESCVCKQIGAGSNLLHKEMYYSPSYTTSSEQWATNSLGKKVREVALETSSSVFDSPHPKRGWRGNQCSKQSECAGEHQQRCCCAHHGGEVFPGCRTIRLATYNMWNLNALEQEGYRDRMERLGKMVSSQDLDVIAVQEVRFEASDHTHNQISDLASFLPDYQYVFQPAMLYMQYINVRTEEGVAILSRHPILHTDYIFLYRNESDEEDSHQRICLHAEILTPLLGKVHIFVTHLSLSPQTQERSVVEIWRYMSQFTGVKVLLGDMNAEPHSAPIRFLRGELPLEGLFTQGLRDTWLAAGEKTDRFTFSALDGQPTKRIDYIFLQPTSDDIAVISNALLDEGDYCDAPCSDHYGVVTTIGHH